MKKISIYDYVKENIELSGKICKGFEFTDYLEEITNKKIELNKDNSYQIKKINLDIEKLLNATKIKKPEFILYAIIDRLLDSFSSNDLEEYLAEKELNIVENVAEIASKIDAKIDRINAKKLITFCKENIMKTQNMYCMYIYLLLASYTNIKDDEALQNIILKIALIPEYTAFISDYVLDKFPYPDYNRFYIAKRIDTLNNGMLSLLSKMSFTCDEVKYWVLENVNFDRSDNSIIDLVDKLELVKLMDKFEVDEKLYKYIGNIICSLLSSFENSDRFEDIFIKYLSFYDNFDINIELFSMVTNIYQKIYNNYYFSEDVKNRLITAFKNKLVTQNTITFIKNEINNNDRSTFEKNELYETILSLNISELYLNLFNILKKEPLENWYLVCLFKDQENLLKEAIEILYKTINWDDYIGEYSALKDSGSNDTTIITLVNFSYDFPEIALKVYEKSLKAKSYAIRYYSINKLYCLIQEGKVMEYNSLPENLKDSVKYLYKNETDISCKELAGEIMGIVSKEYDMSFEEKERRDKIAQNLTLLNQSDAQKVEERNLEKESESTTINLNNIILKGSDYDTWRKGVYLVSNGKVIYIKRVENNLTAWCQGDEFGKEYMVKIKGDQDANIIETFCTCGKAQQKNYCKHIAAALIYQNKLNKSKNN